MGPHLEPPYPTPSPWHVTLFYRVGQGNGFPNVKKCRKRFVRIVFLAELIEFANFGLHTYKILVTYVFL
jgi:hypothetical protein